MKPIASTAPIRYADHHLSASINYARILGRMREASPGFRPSRIKARRLRARLAARATS